MTASLSRFVLLCILIFAPICAGSCECGVGWGAVPRDQGFWCVKFFNYTFDITYSQAEIICANEGAVVSGIQNQQEFDLFANSLDYYKGPNSISAGMWVGGKESDICKTQDCLNLKKTAYVWTDGNTIGTDGFIWQSINPSGNGPCLRLLIDAWGPQLDDVGCDVFFAARNVACGKPFVIT